MNKIGIVECAICVNTSDQGTFYGVLCAPCSKGTDYKTDKVQVLLCSRCNTGMGLLQEDIFILQKTIDYLFKYS